MNNNWKSKNTCIYNINYHIVWIPIYRKKILKGKVRIRLKDLLFEKAKQIDVIIKCHEIMDDHVHLFVCTKPSHKVTDVIKYFKGYSSRILRKEFKHLRKYKSLWTRSYFCESVGHISEKTVLKYIKSQRKHK